jgi:hypothetical protein
VSLIKSFLILATIALSLTFLNSCSAPSQNVYYAKGRHITDRIEPGHLDHIDYEIDLLQEGLSLGYCYFGITYIECRKKRVTALYENVEVTETESYSPNTAEFIADVISFPLKILIAEKLEGTHREIDKRLTGSLVEGETRTNGLVSMPPQALSNVPFSVTLNGKSLRGVYETDSQGLLKIPAKPIVDYYLMDKRVDVNLRGDGVNISKTLPVDYLDKLLNSIYKLGW